MNGSDEYIINRIKRDLKSFADPQTPVIVDRDTAMWEQDGDEREVRFEQAAGREYPNVAVDGEELSYRQFLASRHMADLGHFADFIVRTTDKKGMFIETSGKLEENESDGSSNRAPATDLIRARSTKDLPFGSTRVVLVQGEAGSGKTIALRELTRRQAGRYSEGDTDRLYFYVDAQGRALSRLEDAMAKDLQDLRSRFSYSAVAPLTRHHLLVPIIDGFDELLGSGGYEEAFASLAALLSLLNGQGAVVASARSAFFDYRNFYENAARFSGEGGLNYEVDVVEVLPWSRHQVRDYFTSVAEKHEVEGCELVGELESLETSLDERNRALLSKPFYCSQVAELLLEGWSTDRSDALLDQLVDAFLEREYQKLLDKNGRPLLSKEGHRRFLTSLAEEMWWQESQRLDVSTVQAVAEMVVEDLDVPPTNASTIVERVSAYAFLSARDTERKSLRFEHAVFYGYFLSRKLRESIFGHHADLRRFLNRSVLDETLTEHATRMVGTDEEETKAAIESVCSVLSSSVSEVVARENGGRIIAELVGRCMGQIEGLEVSDVVFRQVSLRETELFDVSFINCDFDEVDMTGLKISDGEFVNCSARNIVVDMQSTCFEGVDLKSEGQFQSFVVENGDDRIRPGEYFAPDQIRSILARLGANVGEEVEKLEGYSDEVEDRVEVLGRFLRKMERRFYASKDDLEDFSFTGSDAWDEVYGLLDANDLLEWEIIQKSGPRKPLVRLSVPPEVVRRGENVDDETVPSEVRSFWRELLNRG